MSSTAEPLDYAPPPARRRRRAVRRGILLTLLVVAGLSGWRYGPHLWQRGQMLYWQRQCMRYSLPPDRAVYDEDPQRVAAAARTGEASAGARSGEILFTDARISSAPLARYHKPEPLHKLSVAAANNRAGAVAFLHNRTAPGGGERLVIVRIRLGRIEHPTFGAQPPVWAYVSKPGRWTGACRRS